MKFKNYKNIEGQFVKIFVFFIKNIICLLKTVYIDDFSNWPTFYSPFYLEMDNVL